MKKTVSRPPQSSLYLRLLAGGYLLYTAWDLRSAVRTDPLLGVTFLVFGAAGVILTVHALKKLIRKEYAGGQQASEPEKAQERTD